MRVPAPLRSAPLGPPRVSVRRMGGGGLRAALLLGDVREALALLPAASAQTCVTSPPFWGLRAYGTEPQVWGARPGCDHDWHPYREYVESGGTALKSTEAFSEPGLPNANRIRDARWRRGADCLRCGAWRGELGGERAAQEYVSHLVEALRAVRRVLREDGTLWLNLGDSYLKGELQMVPARVALALQADGWHLRSEIIWDKPNPLPESVRNRPTRSHEALYLLAKGPGYHYDGDAIREPAAWERWGAQRSIKREGKAAIYADRSKAEILARFPKTKNKRSVWRVPTRSYKGAHFAVFPPALVEPCVLAGSAPGDLVLDPFAGSGTTGEVALKHGRRFVGVDLQPDYLALAAARLQTAAPVVVPVVGVP